MIQFRAPKTRIVAFLTVLLVGGVSSYLIFRPHQGVSETGTVTTDTTLSVPTDSMPADTGSVPLQTSPSKVTGLLGEPLKPPPPDPSMSRMKRQGCVADGLLNGDFPGDGRTMSLVNRSHCYYLHRAIETWLEPPDFGEIDRNLKDLRSGFVTSMFLAEAIDVRAHYDYPFEGRAFDFKKMCRDGSENAWGEGTCEPDLSSKEYRTYLGFITKRAMDRGVQVFMFGQVYLQEPDKLSESRIGEVIADMRTYAAYHGMKIIVGAQTNDITDKKYLSNFDFIEGGVGLSSSGTVENGPCFSRWWKKEGDWCWALLWNDRYTKVAKNVFVHYDWSGKIGDDMSVFTRMNDDERHAVTARLHSYFTGKGVGFLVPYLARLHADNGGCVGPSRRFYTPDGRFTCDDQDAWDKILK
ncbi:MAG TPA: hypothetical protein VN420_00320 [Candidatus Fimivivens sp.]|nr:hypothetical protein [Candidatus Fimivivens sp.]